MVLKDGKSKIGKAREEVAAKSRNIQVSILQWQWRQRRHFCGTCTRTEHKIEQHVVTDLGLRDDENRPSLTSSAVAEERQDVSSKNTIDEVTDAITGGNDIGLWALSSANKQDKMREYCFKYETDSLWHCDEKSLSKHDVLQHRKDRNFHGNVPQVLFVARTTMAKWLMEAGFAFFFQKLVKCFACRLMCADTTECAHFFIGKGIFDRKHALERLRIHEQSVEHKFHDYV